MNETSADQVRAALDAAAQAHHDYEVEVLQGQRDEQWSGFYAAYVLGRLGDLMSSASLATILEKVDATSDWSAAAGRAVVAALAESDPK